MTDKNNSAAPKDEHPEADTLRQQLFYLQPENKTLETPAHQQTQRTQGIRPVAAGKYLPPPEQRAMLDPEYVEKINRIKNEGYFKALIWPAILENPLVPIAIGGAMVAFGVGVRAHFKRDLVRSEKMMWTRVGCQAVAVCLMVFTMFQRERNKKLKTAQELNLKGE